MTKKRSNEATLQKKGDTTMWRIDVRRDGIRKSFYSSLSGRKGKLEAEQKADEWIGEGDIVDLRFSKLWSLYLENIDKSVSSANYIKSEQIGRLWILPSIGSKLVSKITLHDMQKCINMPFEKRNLSYKTCSSVRGCLTCVYRFAKSIRAPLERPEDLTIPKNAKKGKRSILDPSQIQIVFNNTTYKGKKNIIEMFYINSFRFIILTGLRRGEVAALRHDDIIDGVIHLSRSINSNRELTGGKTENAKRIIGLNSLTQAVINDQMAMLAKMNIISPYIFPNRKGEMTNPNKIYTNWKTYATHYNIHCSIHELRHTMISAIQGDVPPELIKSMVGHSKSMDTFGVYGHNFSGDAIRTAKIIDNVFNKRILNNK